MKFYCLSLVVGTGKANNPFRAKISDFGVSYSSIIPTHPKGHPEVGQPINDWCLCIVNTEDTAKLNSEFVHIASQDEMDAISSNAQNIDSFLNERGITGIETSKPSREVLISIGKYLEPKFEL